MRFLLAPIFWLIDMYILILGSVYNLWSAFVDWFFDSIFEAIDRLRYVV